MAMMAALVCACEEKKDDAAASPSVRPMRGPRNPKSVDPALEAVPFNYFYNQLAKRDPFRRQDADVQVRRDEGRTLCNEPLCDWSLEQLKLVAVVSGDSSPLAMMEDPTGYGHIVRRNSKIGQKGGMVTQLLRDCIVVTEYASEGNSDKKTPVPSRICVERKEEEWSVQDVSNPAKLK